MGRRIDRDLAGGVVFLDGKKASDDETKQTKLSFDALGKASVLREDKELVGHDKDRPTVEPMTIDMTWKKGDRGPKASASTRSKTSD